MRITVSALSLCGLGYKRVHVIAYKSSLAEGCGSLQMTVDEYRYSAEKYRLACVSLWISTDCLSVLSQQPLRASVKGVLARLSLPRFAPTETHGLGPKS